MTREPCTCWENLSASGQHPHSLPFQFCPGAQPSGCCQHHRGKIPTHPTPNFLTPQPPLSKTLETPLLCVLVVLDKLHKTDCPAHRSQDQWPCSLSSSCFLRKSWGALLQNEHKTSTLPCGLFYMAKSPANDSRWEKKVTLIGNPQDSALKSVSKTIKQNVF